MTIKKKKELDENQGMAKNMFWAASALFRNYRDEYIKGNKELTKEEKEAVKKFVLFCTKRMRSYKINSN